MRKLIFLLLIIGLLAGCSNHSATYDRYRGMTAEQIFNNGQTAFASKKYDNAVKWFEALDSIYPFGPYAQRGQLDVIYAYYKNDDKPSAMAAADRYTRLYPAGRYVDYAYYMKGLIAYNIGLTWMQRKFNVDQAPRDLSTKKEAFAAFNELVHLFPDSRYAPDAVLHMRAIRNMFARKNMIAAKYYMERKAYVAAVNRASYVVSHFEGSPQVIPALAIMVKAYRKLGLDKLADNTKRIFVASYPSSPQAQNLRHDHG